MNGELTGKFSIFEPPDVPPGYATDGGRSLSHLKLIKLAAVVTVPTNWSLRCRAVPNGPRILQHRSWKVSLLKGQ